MSYWEGKKVVVAGGAGMIGCYLRRDLEREGARTVGVDPEESDSRYIEDTPGHVIKRIEDYEPHPNFGTPDVLFNLAAKVSGIGYNRLANYDMAQANLSPQMAAIDLALKWKCRLVQVSTACVYPHDAPVPTPEEWGWRGEPEPTNSGYGWAKRMGEMLTMWAVKEHGLDAIIARPFNAYGPNDHFEDPNCHVIPALVKRCLRGENPLQVWGTGEQTRSFVHAKDAAKGLMLLAEKAPAGTICNVGHPHQVSIRELAYRIGALCNGTAQTELTFDTSKPDGYAERAADTSLLKSITGWEPSVPVWVGCCEVVEAGRKWLSEGGKEVAL